MIRHLLPLMMLALAWPAGAFAQDLAGTWIGNVRQSDSELAVTMIFEINYDGNWIGRIDIPEWGARLARLRNIEMREQQVSFDVEDDSVTGAFNGSISSDGNTVSGDFVGDSGTFPLEVTRTDSASGDTAALEGAWEGLLDEDEESAAGIDDIGNWQ